MNRPAPQAPTVPPQAPTVPLRARHPEGRSLGDRLRCLAVRVGSLVRAAHSGSVPF